MLISASDRGLNVIQSCQLLWIGRNVGPPRAIRASRARGGNLGEMIVKTIALLSVLALGAMTSAALAVNSNGRDTTTYNGNSSKECTSNCDVPGRTTTTTNKGNDTNTNCAGCGTSGPGKKK